jgi:peroxiredoxin
MFFNEASLTRYKLTATPTTLLIDDHGKIEHAWVGKWDETKTNEVSLALK